MKKRQFVYTFLSLCLLVGGCVSSQNQGKMVRAGDVDQLIESATVLPDHIYYYTGPEARPDVIIAIDNSFTLMSKYWIKVDDVANRLKDWNRLIDNGYRASYRYEGFWLMTPDGRQAGIWYSPYDYTVVQFPDPSTIILYTPSTRDKSGRPSIGGRR